MNFNIYKHYCAQKAFTLIEILVVLALSAILFSIGIVNFKEFNKPLRNDVASLNGFFKKIRLKAISHTQSYKIKNLDSKNIQVLYSDSCDARAWTLDTKESFELSKDVTFFETDWSVCINSRGLPQNALEVNMVDNLGDVAVINLMLGGATTIGKL